MRRSPSSNLLSLVLSAGLVAFLGGSAAAAAPDAAGGAATRADTPRPCDGVGEDEGQLEVVFLTFFHSSRRGTGAGKESGAPRYPLLTDLVGSLNSIFAEQEARPAAADATAGQAKPRPGKPASGEPAASNPLPANPKEQASGPEPDGTAQANSAPAAQRLGRTVVEDLGFGRLLLHGTRCQNLQVKRALARIDVPWPGVQLNLWAIQITGEESSEVYEEVHEIRGWISHARDEIIAAQRELKQLARVDGSPCEDWPKAIWPQSFSLPAGMLSVNEALLLLGLRKDGLQQIDKLRTLVASQQPNDSAACSPRKRHASAYATSKVHEPRYFGRLRDAIKQNEPAEACEALLSFVQSYQAARDLRYQDATAKREDERKQEEILNKVERTRDVVDRIFGSLMDAFAADMEEVFFEPLLCKIRKESEGKHGEGIAIVGHNRIVVTSGLEADLLPEMESYIQTGPPGLAGKDLLELLTPDKGAAGAKKLPLALPQEQGLLLASALLTDPGPQYTKVAPGIAINVIPAVLRDESAARLTIDARFGVSVAELDPKVRKDPWATPPPAGVTSHHIRTDVTVSVFDLFDISSFSIDVATPQRARLVPILGRLPILGPAFQWPLPDKTVHHESIILVNTVILPRSTMLTDRY